MHFFCTATLIIIFIIHINGQSQVIIPDITLLSRVTQDNTTYFTCVAGANVRDSAVTFITPFRRYYSDKLASTSTYISAEGFIYSLDTYDCNFEPGSTCLSRWIQNGPVVESSVSEKSSFHDLELVIDKRWETFTTYFSEFGDVQQHIFQENIHNIGISVRTNGEANILLCEDKYISNCYWIMLPWEKQNKIKVWSCIYINTKRPITDNCYYLGDIKGTACSESNWTHYKIFINLKYGRTYFTIRGQENKDIFLKYSFTSRKTLDIRKILLFNENDKKGLWKIHYYNYLSLPMNFVLSKIGPTFQVDKSGSMCMELYVAVCPTCTLIFGVSNTLYREVVISQNTQRWQLVRLKTHLPQDIILNLYVIAVGDSKGFWLIDDVRLCYEDETRIISVEKATGENDVISCQALQHPNWWSSIKGGRIEQSSLTVCNNQTYTGTSCAVSCTAALGTDCSKVMVCEPSLSRMDPACTCAAGYVGNQCQDLCPQDYYGSGCTRQCEPCEGYCLPATGACNNCSPDHTGPKCLIGMNNQKAQSDYNSALYALLLLLLLIPIIFAVWLFCCRNSKTSNFRTQVNIPLLKFVSRNQDTKSYPIKVEQLAQYLTVSNCNTLEQQYESLPKGPTKSCNYGLLKNNVYKNRINDITAYDHSRVVLKVIGGDPYSDFINANYIDGYKQPKAYIATQGPKANTLNDFWRMIWQENVELIVMLTSIVDKQAKHEQYWSENEKETRNFIDMSVKILKKDVYADFVLRFLEVRCQEDVRQVQHLQFTSWPDNDIPAHPQLLVPFLHEIRSLSTNTRIVVHCSSVILLDICVRMAMQTGKINSLKYLHRMREQRVDMVACFDQYKLVHAVLLEYLLTPDSSIHCDNELPNVISNIIKTKLSQEIAYLNKSKWNHKILRNDVKPSTEISELFPYACGGEYVRFDDVVSVDGFRAKDQYIVIPSIQGNAMKKFWTMIIEHNVEEALVLEDLSNCKIWPTEAKQILELPHLTIKCISKSEGSSYSTYRLQLQMKSSLVVKSVRVLVQSPEQMGAQALAQLAAEALTAAQRRRLVAVGGAAGAGLVVLAHVMERMLVRHQCDVLGSLRALRACGLTCLPDEHQLRLLYSASIYALDELDGYMQPISRF